MALECCSCNEKGRVLKDALFQKIIGKDYWGVVSGRFPRRALNAVLDWYVLHQEELMANWQAAIDRKPLSKIEPLE
jgi:hypothetical protein